ncbi:hypothetical protein VitviT2T_013452 [Vitis vinifera]|uniref:Late embryogenesis abundant protein LEA-2 subgroup domain-containing protein n=1 Tax=Vitis vinifera TaxID=29760 RepID=A0ABY9CII2_VITVI|nr:uncharacterized protein LOC100258307 [Vitis vinifera]WJZ94612.1 hypothetical protein VitviT2T_013452 [Vitis vinifera]|eukprot:XP_002279706.1 PREDICTED: uncharacterized protein LOC100258307 [Vitis vinifera]
MASSKSKSKPKPKPQPQPQPQPQSQLPPQTHPQLPYYTPVPSHPASERNYVVLPLYIPLLHRRCNRFRLLTAASVLLLVASTFVLWPSDPDVSIVRLRLRRIAVHTFPRLSLDVSMSLMVKVRNVDLYSMNYRSLHVAIEYRGKELGNVTSEEGHVRARGSSLVDASLELNGVAVLSDVIFVLEDLAKGTIPIDTVTEVRGSMGFLFFQLPLRTKVSCQVYVNTNTQKVLHQNCYPE